MGHQLTDADVTYLTNACGEETGYGTFKEMDAEKIAFEDGPGCVLPYLVKIKNKKYAQGNLEVAYKDEFWGDYAKELSAENDVRAYCEAMCADIQQRLEPGMHLLAIDDGMLARFVVSVAVPLKMVANSDKTKQVLQRVFGKFVDLPDLEETTAKLEKSIL